MENSLTICSVSYNSAGFLRLNYKTTKTLNPRNEIRWIIAENSPRDSTSRLAANEPHLTVIEGSGSGHIPTYHHTLALRRCVEQAETRFILVIDPDLFVVRQNWVSETIMHMRERDLAILGVPWHPQSSAKYRYFPAVHFSLFDTHRFPKSAIDFRPDVPNGETDPDWDRERGDSSKHFFLSRGAAQLAKLPVLSHRRRRYTDTGSRLYKQWAGDPSLHYEIMDPVWDPQRGIKNQSLAGKILQRLLPDELCYQPKHYQTKYRSGFLDSAISDDFRQNWEQFMWRDAPFCFHVRLNLERSSRDAHSEISAAEKAIRSISSQQKH